MASKSKSPSTSTITGPSVTAQVVQPHGPPTGSELSRSQFASLLAAIKDSESRLDQRFSDFKGAQEEAAKRVRHEKPYDYKKKAHEEQATFNAKVQDALKEATDALDDTADSPAIQRAKTAVEEGKHLLAERQKLIKIADRSANGWGVVAEYTADELAVDSDDEKRLEKAEKAAERKAGLKWRRKQQPAQRGAAQTRTQRYTAYGGYTVPQLYPPSFPQLQQTASGAGQSVRRAGGSAGTMQRVSVGPCFACGEMGHLRMYCPKIQTQEKKWYPSQCMCVGSIENCVVVTLWVLTREVLLIVVLVMSIQPAWLAGTGR